MNILKAEDYLNETDHTDEYREELDRNLQEEEEQRERDQLNAESLEYDPSYNFDLP